MTALPISPLASKLLARGPAAELGDGNMLYGFLPGSWEADAVIHRPGGEHVKARGEIHAGWVLEGRAIQDVWILPGSFHGTTLRLYDPSIDAWHIHWHDPLKHYYPRMIGRPSGPDIVQEGRSESGEIFRWRFTQIQPDSFHWIADVSADDRTNWKMQLEFFARRLAA